MSELNKLLQRLIDADVPFVIVGGFGGMLHGSSLVTRDLDVCAVLTDANVRKLRSTFSDLHPENPEPGVAVKNLYLQTDFRADGPRGDRPPRDGDGFRGPRGPRPDGPRSDAPRPPRAPESES